MTGSKPWSRSRAMVHCTSATRASRGRRADTRSATRTAARRAPCQSARPPARDGRDRSSTRRRRRAAPRPRARPPTGRAGSAASRVAPAARFAGPRALPQALTSPDSDFERCQLAETSPAHACRARPRRERLLRRPQTLGGLAAFAPLHIERRELVHALGELPPRLASAARTSAGLATDQPEVQHCGAAHTAIRRLRRHRRCRPCQRRRSASASSPPTPSTRQERAMASFSAPVAMFSGMIAPEKPPVLDRVSTSLPSPCGCRSSGRRRSPCR